MTSRLVVNSVRHTGASADAITMDASGNVTFPANATCSGTATGFGKVRQHKILSKISKSSTTSTSLTIIPDFSITITPTASDSIMVVEACVFYSINTHVITTRIQNGTSMLIEPHTFDSNDDGSGSLYGSGDRMNQQQFTAFETAGNTNARTYNVYWRVSSGTAYINRYYGSDSYNSVSTLRVTEMAP